jgi:excisionase family DNA binding protein
MDTIPNEDLAQRIEGLRGLLENKPLSFPEACRYLNLSASYLYKLTHRKAIPYYKPTGKRVFFDRSQLDAFLRQKPIATFGERLEAIDAATKRSRVTHRKPTPVGKVVA